MRISKLTPALALGLLAVPACNPPGGILGNSALNPQAAAIADTSAQNNSSFAVMASWSSVSNANSYKVTYTDNTGATSTDTVQGGNTTTDKSTNASAGKSYSATVQAYDGNFTLLKTETSATASVPTPTVPAVAASSYTLGGSAVQTAANAITTATVNNPTIGWAAATGATFYYVEVYPVNGATGNDPNQPLWATVTSQLTAQVGQQGSENINSAYLPTKTTGLLAPNTPFNLVVTAIRGNASGSFSAQTSLDIHRGTAVRIQFSQ